MNNSHGSWMCRYCKQTIYAGASHWCPSLGRMDGVEPVKPLTEADVRRIVREELERGGSQRSGDA